MSRMQANRALSLLTTSAPQQTALHLLASIACVAKMSAKTFSDILSSRLQDRRPQRLKSLLSFQHCRPRLLLHHDSYHLACLNVWETLQQSTEALCHCTDGCFRSGCTMLSLANAPTLTFQVQPCHRRRTNGLR